MSEAPPQGEKAPAGYQREFVVARNPYDIFRVGDHVEEFAVLVDSKSVAVTTICGPAVRGTLEVELKRADVVEKVILSQLETAPGATVYVSGLRAAGKTIRCLGADPRGRLDLSYPAGVWPEPLLYYAIVRREAAPFPSAVFVPIFSCKEGAVFGQESKELTIRTPGLWRGDCIYGFLDEAPKAKTRADYTDIKWPPGRLNVLLAWNENHPRGKIALSLYEKYAPVLRHDFLAERVLAKMEGGPGRFHLGTGGETFVWGYTPTD